MSAPTRLKRVVLIGFSATGKSVLAPYIAHKLGWTAVDLDVEIERVAGRTIPQIFESEGESGFRSREHQAVKDAADRDGLVVATGGGVWLNSENRSLLAEQGLVVTAEQKRSHTPAIRYNFGSRDVPPSPAMPDKAPRQA